MEVYSVKKREHRDPGNCFQIAERPLCGERTDLSVLSRWQDRICKWVLESKCELRLGKTHFTSEACPTQKELSHKL